MGSRSVLPGRGIALRGATFQGGVEDHGYGLVTMVEVPGADPVQLYEPRHAVPYSLPAGTHAVTA